VTAGKTSNRKVRQLAPRQNTVTISNVNKIAKLRSLMEKLGQFNKMFAKL